MNMLHANIAQTFARATALHKVYTISLSENWRINDLVAGHSFTVIWYCKGQFIMSIAQCVHSVYNYPVFNALGLHILESLSFRLRFCHDFSCVLRIGDWHTYILLWMNCVLDVILNDNSFKY